MQKPATYRLTILAFLATLVTGAMVVFQFFQVFSPSETPVEARVPDITAEQESLFRSPQSEKAIEAPVPVSELVGTVFGDQPGAKRLQLDAFGYGEPPFGDRLRKEINLIEENFPGSISLYVSDIKRGYAWGHFEDRLMYLASGVKLLVMIEAYRQREEGKLRFTDELFYGPEDLRDGAPDLNRRRVNQYFSVEELLGFMISNSDNAAADLLIKRLGVVNIRHNLIEDGFDNIPPIVPLMHVRRHVYEDLDPRAKNLSAKQLRAIRWSNGFQPNLGRMRKYIGAPYGQYDYRHMDEAYERYYLQGSNHLTMRTVGKILEKMVTGQLVSGEASEAMLERLVQVWSSGHRIRGALKPAIRVAHKTGTQHKRLADLSVVFMPDKTPLVLTMAVAGGRRQDAERVMFTLAERIYQYAWNYSLGLGAAPIDKNHRLAEVLMECRKPQPEGYQGPQVNP